WCCGGVVDEKEGTGGPVPQARVVVEELAHRAEGEGDVVQPRLLDGLGTELTARLRMALGQGTEVDERHPVVLVVVGHEAQVRVLPDDVTAEDGRVPVSHRGEPVGLEDDVGELAGWHEHLLLHEPHCGCYGSPVGVQPMNILLLSMPDSFEHMPTVGIRMPNGALTSLAGNVDPHHRVAVAPLILAQRAVRATVERLVHETRPDLVGLSVMTFQRRTALRIVELVRGLRPEVRIVVGGYDPSLAVDAYTGQESGVSFVVRGEGELTFRELVRAVERGGGFQ